MKKKIGVSSEKKFNKYIKRLRIFENIFNVELLPYRQNSINQFEAIISFENELVDHPKTIFFPISEKSNILNQEKQNYIYFSDTDLLDYSIKNKSIYDSRSSSLKTLSVKENDIILAKTENGAVWVKRINADKCMDIVSLCPAELKSQNFNIIGGKENFFDFSGTLRYELNEERFFSYLPIIHWFREVCANDCWSYPKLRASFIVDDPNVRFMKYGNLDYRKIIKAAKLYNFHLSLATIPIDLFWASKKSIKLLKANSQFISLMIHGNNHLKREMLRTNGNEFEFVSQALQRVERFENKYGISISRVIVPPHESFSMDMCTALSCAGIEALCNSRPFGWVNSDNKEFKSDSPYIGYYPSDLVSGGLPIITRRGLNTDYSLRAFLRQPIIVYFHHKDIDKNLNKLKSISEKINSLGNVSWENLTQISRSNYLQKIESNLLRIKAFSRKIKISIPENIDEIQIEFPYPQGTISNEYLVIEGNRLKFKKDKQTKFIKIPLNDGMKREFTVSIHCDNDVKLKEAKILSTGFSPYLRRLLTELRDRFAI